METVGIIADAERDWAPRGLENKRLVPACCPVRLRIGKVNLSVGADDSFGAAYTGGIVDDIALFGISLREAVGDINTEFFCKLRNFFGRGAGHCLGQFILHFFFQRLVLLVVISRQPHLGKNDQIGTLCSCGFYVAGHSVQIGFFVTPLCVKGNGRYFHNVFHLVLFSARLCVFFDPDCGALH